MKVLGIYGAGGLGKEVLELAKIINNREKRWEEIVFVVDDSVLKSTGGIEIFSLDEVLQRYDNVEFSVAVGEPSARLKLFEKLNGKSVKFATLIHPDVHIPDSTEIGDGATIQYGCFISCETCIGKNVYIQPNVNIGHNNIIGDGCVISGMCSIGGNVSIGEWTYVGLSAVIKEGIKIGKWSIVGMASAVYKDIPDDVIALGNPARPMKKNEDRHVFK